MKKAERIFTKTNHGCKHIARIIVFIFATLLIPLFLGVAKVSAQGCKITPNPTVGGPRNTTAMMTTPAVELGRAKTIDEKVSELINRVNILEDKLQLCRKEFTELENNVNSLLDAIGQKPPELTGKSDLKSNFKDIWTAIARLKEAVGLQ